MVYTILIFLLIICSFSVYASGKFHKRFEEVLPITMMGMAAILFFSGILGVLKAGLWIVWLLAVLFYLLFLYEWIRAEHGAIFLKSFFKRFCTPGFFVFILLYFLFAYSFRGMKAVAWDDFSHWVDSVKVMTLFNDFATNPKGFSLFPSYPPGLSLLQYFIQKVHNLLHPNLEFTEWFAYFVYHVYYVAILLPFFRKIPSKKWVSLVSLTLIIGLLPLTFAGHFYTSSYIDSLLSAVAVAGFLYLAFFEENERDIFYYSFIALCIFTLVLLKDVGLLLAVFVVIYYLLHYINRRKISTTKPYYLLGLIASCVVPKLLWARHLNITGTIRAFSNHYNLFNVSQVPYFHEVLAQVFYKLGTEKSTVFSPTFSFSNLSLILIGLAALYIVMQSKSLSIKKEAPYLFYVILAFCLIFLLGLPFIYTLNFSKKEALMLAEFTRYISIPISIVYTMAAILLVKALYRKEDDRAKIYSLFLIAGLLIFTNDTKLFEFLLRVDTNNSIAARQEIDKYANKVLYNTGVDARIYVVFNSKQQSAYFVLKSHLKPRLLTESFDDTILQIADENDVVNWMEKFYANYNHLLIYEENNTFSEKFSGMFYDPDDIRPGLYRLESKDGLLHRVELDGLPAGMIPEE